MKKRKFYTHKDRNGGHPSLIYYADHKNDTYKAVCFTSASGKGRKQLRHSINPKTADKTYVMNQPVVSDHKTFKYNKKLKGFRVRRADKKLVDSIKQKK